MADRSLAPPGHTESEALAGDGAPAWQERLATIVATATRRRQRVAQVRAEFAAARAAGLASRHRAKLARTRDEQPAGDSA